MTRMPLDRFAVQHRVAWSKFVGDVLRRRLRALPDPLVRPFAPLLSSAFVVGCGHSGTTLLAAKLGRLAGCFVPGWETSIFLPDHGLAWSKAAFGALRKSAEASGHHLILEKTPKHVHCASRILRLLPEARFLVMTRNPLDTCASLFERFGDLDYAIERWNLDNTAAAALIRRNCALQIRYESLTTTPSVEFARAAEFLGLTWDDAALEPGETVFAQAAAEENMARRALEVAAPIVPRNGLWRQRLASSQAEQVVAATRDLAAKLGYDGDVFTE